MDLSVLISAAVEFEFLVVYFVGYFSPRFLGAFPPVQLVVDSLPVI